MAPGSVRSKLKARSKKGDNDAVTESTGRQSISDFVFTSPGKKRKNNDTKKTSKTAMTASETTTEAEKDQKDNDTTTESTTSPLASPKAFSGKNDNG